MPSQDIIRVLIVDDIMETRESIRRMLQFDKSIEVVGTARNGREAIELAEKLKPDVILMDINMPDMDGITATDLIRRKLSYAQVIILSVQNDPDYMRRAMRAGAHDFLPKPPMIDELTSTIRRAGQVAVAEKVELDRKRAALSGGGTVQTAGGGGGGGFSQGKVITVYSPKGGVGCTTIATNLALSMLAEGKKVALLDASMQFGDVPVFLSEQVKNSILDLAERVDELDPDIVEEVMIKHSASELRILASCPRPEQADGVTGEQFGKLLQYLRKLFSFIIVDTAAYLSDVTLSAIEGCDALVLVTTQDIPAIKNVSSFMLLSDAMGVERGRMFFVMNRYDKRVGVTSELVAERLRQEIVLSIPFDDRVVADSIKRGKPLMLENKTHPVSRSISSLGDLIRAKFIKQEQPEAVATKK